MADNTLTVVLTSENVTAELKTTSKITTQVTSGARGKSAYESWLDQGNTGTEADFITALLQDQTYVHNQQVASETWTITHNLNKFPSVTIINSVDQVVIGDIEYLSNNSIKVSFTAGFSGKAYLN